MNRILAGSLAATVAALAVAGGGGAKTDDKGPHLRYATTYAGAIEEGRARNCLVFVTFHKDH